MKSNACFHLFKLNLSSEEFYKIAYIQESISSMNNLNNFVDL